MKKVLMLMVCFLVLSIPVVMAVALRTDYVYYARIEDEVLSNYEGRLVMKDNGVCKMVVKGEIYQDGKYKIRVRAKDGVGRVMIKTPEGRTVYKNVPAYCSNRNGFISVRVGDNAELGEFMFMER